MNRLLIAISIVLALVSVGFAQDKSAASVATLQKMRQIDLLNHLLPLVLQKEQIRKMLPTIEKARRDVKTQQDEEAKFLQQYSPKIEKAVKDGVEKGDVPDKELLKELNALVRMMTMKRSAVISDNTQMVLEIFKSTLNAGQLKAAANSLDFKLYNPNIKPEEVKDEDRIRLFVQEVLLDPLAYDLLVKMQSGARG